MQGAIKALPQGGQNDEAPQTPKSRCRNPGVIWVSIGLLSLGPLFVILAVTGAFDGKPEGSKDQNQTSEGLKGKLLDTKHVQAETLRAVESVSEGNESIIPKQKPTAKPVETQKPNGVDAKAISWFSPKNLAMGAGTILGLYYLSYVPSMFGSSDQETQEVVQETPPDITGTPDSVNDDVGFRSWLVSLPKEYLGAAGVLGSLTVWGAAKFCSPDAQGKPVKPNLRKKGGFRPRSYRSSLLDEDERPTTNAFYVNDGVLQSTAAPQSGRNSPVPRMRDQPPAEVLSSSYNDNNSRYRGSAAPESTRPRAIKPF